MHIVVNFRFFSIIWVGFGRSVYCCLLYVFNKKNWFGFGKSFSFLKTVSSQGDQKLGHAIYAPNLGMSILNTQALIVIDYPLLPCTISVVQKGDS